MGHTPLHEASDDKVAELLIKAGADINITDEVSYSHACAIVNKLVYYVISRLTSVSCEAKKNACMSNFNPT